MDLKSSLHIAGSGMRAQSERLKVIAENVANADSLAIAPGGSPYRRKTISFENVLNRELGIAEVRVAKIGVDNSPFEKVYDPGNPVADAEGYVEHPNVNVMMEMQDMKEAQRSYEANLSTIEISKGMLLRTLDLLR